MIPDVGNGAGPFETLRRPLSTPIGGIADTRPTAPRPDG
jgi:hypothetical protein